VISKPCSEKIGVSFVFAVIALCAPASFTAAQSSGRAASASAQSLDYEFFETRVEPIFLKKRDSHARCYICHSVEGRTAPRFLEKLPPGSTFWTEDQSRRNFQLVSLFVVPGDPTSSPLLMHPLDPEAGGDTLRVHAGGRQFASEDDPDWKTIAEWVREAKPIAQGKSTLPSNASVTDQEAMGRYLFLQRCSLCHLAPYSKVVDWKEPDAYPIPVGPRVAGLLKGASPGTEEAVREFILKGSGDMPGWQYALDPKEIDDLMAYLKTLKE
jgi:mono/diheme cytochrome c family protein